MATLPIIRKTNRYKVVSSDTGLVQNESIKPEAINKMLKSYRLPLITPRNELTGQDSDNESLNTERKKYKYFKNKGKGTNSLSILHDKVLYPSVEQSREIIAGNRILYERMEGILRTAEANNFKAAFRSCKYEKDKLKFYTHRARIIRPVVPMEKGY